MKVLFSLRHVGYIRNFESTVRGLAERGHHVHLVIEKNREDPSLGRPELVEPAALAERLLETYPNITQGDAPSRDANGAAYLRRKLRLGIDYLRYLDDAYKDAHKLRARAEEHCP